MLPYGISTFCDDIRFEMQNKFSLIGCYGPDLIIYQQPPIVLPKLAILVQIRIPTEQFPAIKIMVYSPGKETPLFMHEQPTETEKYVPPPLKETQEEDIEQQRALIWPLIFSPFSIEKLGYVRVRMLYRSETIRVGALNIKYQDLVAPQAVS